MATGWDAMHHKVKSLEARLEKKVQNYSSIAQRINANFLCDEENPLVESNEEQILANEIERDLNDLYDCIQNMRQYNSSSLSSNQEALIKRYYEIHYDYTTEFRNTCATVQRKRESMELLMQTSNRRNNNNNNENSAMNSLLREKDSISSSMKSIQDIIKHAWETKETLIGQRSTLMGANTSASGIQGGIPSINSMIDGISKKKSRESIVIALVIAGLVCFTIWWMCLR